LDELSKFWFFIVDLRALCSAVLHLIVLRWNFVGFLSFVQIFTQQQVVVVARKMPDELLKRVEVQSAEATFVPTTRLWRIDDISMN
jgi:hypothetical protein